MNRVVRRDRRQWSHFFYLVILLAGIFFVHLARAAGPYGTDDGWVIDNSGNPLFTSSDAAVMSQAEVGWVRIEMRLIGSHTNWDSTMLGYYDTAVNTARSAGLQVLLLIDYASWPGGQSDWTLNNWENNHGTNGDNPYVEGFATNAALVIVQHFKDRVKVYEVWNEPNAWTSSPSNGVFTGGSFLYPSNYGWLLARTWETVHKTHGITNVTLFSGGVFGHNISGQETYSTAGAQYIDDFYSTGTNINKGGAFAYIFSKYAAYPLDGIGEHIYISQAGNVVGATFRQYEDWVHQACTKYEGVNTPKKTFITEFGWQTPLNGIPSATVQNSNLVTSFNTIIATPYVQLAIWFQLHDNPAGGMYFGVLNSSGVAKPSYTNFQHFERFEGINSDGTTNSSIANYFTTRGQSLLGNPFDNGHGAWVYAFLTGFAQDFAGGAHSNALVMTTTNGTFELNDLHGILTFYDVNLGGTNYGAATNNEFTLGSTTRQDFTKGYLSWDSTNQVVWHSNVNPAGIPGGLTATPSNALVTLIWNTATNATGYYLKRSKTNGSGYATIAANLATTNYLDAPLTNGTTYYYVVTATNLLGESANSAQVSALPAAPPVISPQPHSLTVNQGKNASFSLAASSAVPFTYAWQFNGSNISGANTNVLMLTNVLPTTAGNYTAIVSNYGGATISSNAVLSIRPIMTATTQSNGTLVINWNGAYTLQSATNVNGPFSTVDGAASPFTNPFTMPRQFFRLQK